MKTKSKGAKVSDLRPEYNFGALLKKGVRGKYATRFQEGTNLVLLAPDVAKAFQTDEAVNAALRLVIRLTKLPSPNKKIAAKA
jgi:hypothetical protein